MLALQTLEIANEFLPVKVSEKPCNKETYL